MRQGQMANYCSFLREAGGAHTKMKRGGKTGGKSGGKLGGKLGAKFGGKFQGKFQSKLPTRARFLESWHPELMEMWCGIRETADELRMPFSDPLCTADFRDFANWAVDHCGAFWRDDYGAAAQRFVGGPGAEEEMEEEEEDRLPEGGLPDEEMLARDTRKQGEAGSYVPPECEGDVGQDREVGHERQKIDPRE